jgi:hypothetical protein
MYKIQLQIFLQEFLVINLIQSFQFFYIFIDGHDTRQSSVLFENQHRG